ncbi:hypothetical protein ASPWEDRAFT_121856 [Aspergillus wentii DTO 134E9]|uniref:Uncharacterized protein n=1 Tax=Aspergillus wentii DTO 134E9 TaxID=1073089 RepID=A0A1L9R4T1_ASPWE|nr:uncharacterized protein ASPWEDRAFT_121856 [Aspergillus wentii DTO 134E9]OJJ29893.1 hypothetical protein ASPWEDRAFT_121856 [Aspergillus wentii DTO 134E9]
MVVILAKFDKQPQPIWAHMSLNPLVSWLSTVSKGCILYGINEALGQLKWVWFMQKTRPMPNLRTFDSASRGFYGSAELIWTLRCQHFAVWGSLAVIMSLAFDPFAQNLVHYYPNSVEDTSQSALISNTTFYGTVGPMIRGGAAGFWVDPVLKANVYNSLFNNDDSKPWSIPKYTCPSSNCTWDVISAIEARTLCTNVTEHLNISCASRVTQNVTFTHLPNCTVSLPHSNTLAWYIDPVMIYVPIVINAITNQSETLVYKNSTFPIMQMIAPDRLDVVHGRANTSRWQAMECSIEPVVHSFRPTVHENVYREEMLGIWNEGFLSIDRNMTNVTPGLYFQPPWGPEYGMPANGTFGVSAPVWAAMTTLYKNMFSGYYSEQVRSSVLYEARYPDMYAGSDVIQAFTHGNITGCNMNTVEKLSCAMHNVAQAISKSFRDASYVEMGSDLSRAQMASGRVMASMTYVEIRWWWITLPALVWVLGAATLVGTMWKSRRGVPRWKNDPVPLLFLHQDGNTGVSEREPEEKADGLEVRLYHSNDKMVLGGLS